MKSLNLTGLFVGIIALFVIAISGVSFAQSESEQVANRRAQLEKDLAAIEAEIDKQRVFLEKKQRERVSLERDVAIIEHEIEKAQLSIRARDLEITKITENISGKEETIGALNEKLVREKQSLAQLIRRTNEIDDYTIAEILLGNQDLSDFFEDLDSFEEIKGALDQSFDDIEVTKENTEAQKVQLIDRRTSEQELRQIQVFEKRKIERREDEKQKILDVTKGEEGAYQSLINEKQKSAAQIRTELFTLRGTAAIPFERALELANAASAKTDVRPAFILGVIAEESNLGENVGTGNWRTDMHPTRDRPVFEDITNRLGLDPDQLPVSKKPWYGWGGAMGPAQFIPSTWILYEKRIAKITGQDPPNPWDPSTAFMASALLLMDNGADKGTYSAERLAALRYFAGWRNATKPAYAFYGDEVMELATKYQGLIDILASS